LAIKPDKSEILSRLPSVDRILAETVLGEWKGSSFTTETVRVILDEIREKLLEGTGITHTTNEIATEASRRLNIRFAPQLRRVINATGIIIHTNLGRSPLSEKAIEAMVRAARGYSSLEYDLKRGRRGSRHTLVHEILTTISGAEDALVTNNNAAAMLLGLTALSKRKEVIVSRSQLVEIGGSFRVPDICKAGGAKLKEVGTTNRTRIADYENATSTKTGMLLRVHSSNYKVIGFTEEVSLEALVDLGDKYNIPVMDDLGSGALVDIARYSSLKDEPLVADSVKAGASVVTFSGDKLLGGPQAGLAVGKSRYIDKMRKHPLMRAVRPDKITFAALHETLRAYLVPKKLAEKLPVWRMMSVSLKEIGKRAHKVAADVTKVAEGSGLKVCIDKSDSYAGGGSLPTQMMESRSVCFSGTGKRLKTLQENLRNGIPPIICYIKDGKLHLDLRTLILEDDNEVTELLLKALKMKED